MPNKKKPAETPTQQANEPKTNDTPKQPKAQATKSREWWCCVYPESAPENWKELVQQTFLEAYISPLHNQDYNPDGTVKKAHYHVVLAWPGPTTFSNAQKIMQEFGGVIQPRVIGSLRGVCRYLCHLDNPEKAQYKPEDVICYNGADWLLVINLKSDKYTAIEEMQDWCIRYRVQSFLDLNTYARNERKADWFRCLCDGGSYIMREFCKSLKWELETKGYLSGINEIKDMMARVDADPENPDSYKYRVDDIFY